MSTLLIRPFRCGFISTFTNRGEIAINQPQQFRNASFASSAGMHSLFHPSRQLRHNRPDVRSAALPPSRALLQSPSLSRSPSWESLRERSCICIIVFSAIVGGLSGRAAAATGRLGHLSRTNQAALCAASGPLPARAHIHMLMNKLIKYDLDGQKRTISLLMRAHRVYLLEYHDKLRCINRFHLFN